MKRHYLAFFAAVVVVMGMTAGVGRGQDAADGAWRTASGAVTESADTERITVRTLSTDGHVQRLEFRFPAPRVARGPDGVFDVTMPSAEVAGYIGAPVLPSISARVGIPQGHELVQIEVVPGPAHEYVLDGPVRHAQAPYPLSRPEDVVTVGPSDAIYGGDAPYPESARSPYSVQFKRGVTLAHFVLHPVTYRPRSGRITAVETLIVEVTTQPEAELDQGAFGIASAEGGVWRARFRSESDALAVSPLLDNPALLDAYAPEPPPPSPDFVLAQSGLLPARPSDTFQHVIITSAELRDSALPHTFDDIVTLRAAEGLASVIVTVEEILGTYPGIDEAEAVRTFIRDAYNKWDTEYVLLGGWTNAVPMRALFAQVGFTQDHIPSDLYFQCLDGSFDSNGNGIWGQFLDGADRMDGRPGEDIDLYAEVAIGRVPVATPAQLDNWVRKQLRYEADRLAGDEAYLRGALMIGEHLGFGGISEYGGPMMEEIRLGAATHGYRTDGFTQLNVFTNVVTLYDTPRARWERADLVALLNQDAFSALNHIGHSDFNWNMKIGSAHVEELQNERPAFVYSQGCWAGAFDRDSIAAAFLGRTPHGLFGGVFNSREGWGRVNSTDGPSQRYNRWFWHAYFGDWTPVTGVMNQQAHERNAARINEPAMRWVYYTSNLLGDPAQWLYGIEPEVTLDRGAYRSDAAATVNVTWPMVGYAVREVSVTVQVLDPGGVETGVTNVVSPRIGRLSLTGRFRSPPVDLAGLGAVNGGSVVASAELSLGAGPATYTDEAPIRDDPPVITNLRVEAVDDIWIDVAWDTDVPALGAARAGEVLPLAEAWTGGDPDYVTNHVVRLGGLKPFTHYFIAVRAEDQAGNIAMLPVDGFSIQTNDYLQASTLGREITARFNFERSPEGWTATNINGVACWEYGRPTTYGPVSQLRAWGTILNGRYPSGANATLTSPVFPVRESPLIRFRHWHDIQYSMQSPGVVASPAPFGDYGQVEVKANGVWHNVTRYADVTGGATFITGNSAGWQNVRLPLPPEFANQSLAIRFRFVSDQQSFQDGNPAGWYLDSVNVSDVPGSGIGISVLDVRDDDGADLGLVLDGDGDGFAEAGETVAVRPRLFNYGTSTFAASTGSFVVLVEGNPSADAVLPDGSPAAVSYAAVAPGQEVPASAWTRLQLSPELPIGTVVTLLQTVTSTAGTVIESRIDLVVGDYVTIEGVVLDIATDLPIAGARLAAVHDDGTLLTSSASDGTFVLNGAVRFGTYAVTASKPGSYSPQTHTVQAPVSNLVFRLGRSIGVIFPDALEFEAWPGDSDSALLTATNDATATAPFEVALDEVLYMTIEADWFTLAPEAVSVAAGELVTLEAVADAANLGPGEYPGLLVLRTNDPGQPRVEIPLLFRVRQQPALVFGGVVVDGDDNENGYLEAGETGDMWIYLNNLSGLSEAIDIHGVLEFVPRDEPPPPQPAHWVTPTGSTSLVWTYIPPYGSRLSDNGVGLTFDAGIPEGEPLDFRLSLDWHDGIAPQSNVILFTYIHYSYQAVTGTVRVVRGPDDDDDDDRFDDNDQRPVAGAVVHAETYDGLRYSSVPTDTNGVYRLPAVPHQDLWFTVAPPLATPYVPPAGTNIFVDAPLELDFLMENYGVEAPYLRLFDVVVDDTFWGDGDGAIDPGERLTVRPRIWNSGLDAAHGVTGLLARADMGMMGPHMEVTGETAYAGMLLPLPAWYPTPDAFGGFYLNSLYTFEVEVDPAAQPGDRQRFQLWVADQEEPARVWPVDFILTVDPRYSVSGTVTYRTDGAPAPGVRVRASYPGGTAAVMTDINGAYRFVGLPHGVAVTVRVDPPEGYTVEPASQTIDPLDADTVGIDFELVPGVLQITPPSLHATVNEGESAAASLTLVNDGTFPLSVDLKVHYKRSAFETVPPEDDPVAMILAGQESLDWAALGEDDFMGDELEIRFADGTGWMERQEILADYGLRALFHLKLVPACVAVPLESTALGEGDGVARLAPLARALGGDPRILYVQPAARVEPQALPNDPLFDSLWGMHNERQTGGSLGADINVAPVWDNNTGSRQVIVAIADTGMDIMHDDLVQNLWHNPLEQAGDANNDGYPGVRGIDDDGDAEQQRYHFNPLTGELQGPEVVHPLFAPAMWTDNRSYVKQPGTLSQYHWVDGANDIPDFFEPFLQGHETFAALRARAQTLEDVHYNLIGDILVDSTGDGVPDIFLDSDGDGIPDIFADEDGDGIINETGIDFRDEDVMLADYNFNGRPLLIQKFVNLPWFGGRSFRVLVEQWDVLPYPRLTLWNDGNGRTIGIALPPAMEMATWDDDENGFADDFHGWNFFNWNNDVSDGDLRYGHGTHVAGTVGAAGDNGIGVAGVNWEVSLMALRLTSAGKPVRFTTYGRIAKAMEYALEKGVQVSNHSWGGSQTAGILYEVMKRAERDYNHLFVIAAGNSANDLDHRRIYPAYFSTVLNNVITVAASDHHGQLAPFSVWGKESVHLAAPGVDILSTIPDLVPPRMDAGDDDGIDTDVVRLGGTWGTLSGTSMASPHVAGAAALLWAHGPDARYEAIREALLTGVRPDPNLDGWVRTGGHLDIGRALGALGRDWLVLSTNHVELAVGEGATVGATFNPYLDTRAGFYEADVMALSEAGRSRVPASLTVLAQPLPLATGVRIVSDTDGDGLAEPGETVEFHITLHNRGSLPAVNLQGVLTAVTPGVVVETGTAAWDIIYAGESGESLTAFRVVLPAGAPPEVLFDLQLTGTDMQPQTVAVRLPVAARHVLSGQVVTLAGDGVGGALVEYRGTAGGHVVTDADGAFAIEALEDGSYTLRALPATHTRSADVPVTLTGGDLAGVELVVGSPDVTFSLDGIDAALLSGMTQVHTQSVANTSAESYAFEVEVMPARSIGLFDDGTGLGVLVEPLRRMGFAVMHYTNNFATVHYRHPVTAYEMVLQEIRHTWDDEKVFQHDFVIADLTGPRGDGRVVSDGEVDVFTRYLARGGRVMFTGGNPLNRPDNRNVAELAGVGLDRAGDSEAQAVAVADWDGRFVQLGAGDRVAVTALRHDLASPAAGTEVLFTVGAASKLTRRAGATGAGTVYLWGGNPQGADWSREGVWLDVLRDILRDAFMATPALQIGIPWLQVAPLAGSVAGGVVDLSLTLSTTGLQPGDYAGTVILLGRDRGSEVFAMPVRMGVHTHTLRALTTGRVSDWRGIPMRGDGGEASPLYQVIYAGADGVANPPDSATGAPTGDDRLLAAFPSGQAFGRFGDGAATEADSGRFNRLFSHAIPQDMTNAQIYVRAWDAATFASALAYGDSEARYRVTFAPGETADFGSWQVTNVINFTRDSNTNSLPDGWVMKHRPDLDPRAPVTPLQTSYTSLGVVPLQWKPLQNESVPRPHRVVLSAPDEAFMFVLDTVNNRIVVIPSATPQVQVFVGSAGAATGRFAQPEGLAIDPRAGEYRLAVADTDNHRIQLFTYAPGTGALTFERAFGSLGNGTNQLNRPSAVAFDHTGRLYVADQFNNRIAVFRVADGAWQYAFTGSGPYVLKDPRGLTVDPDPVTGGVWVADTGNHRVTLYSLAGAFKQTIGSHGAVAGRFNTPTDVQIWRHRWLDPDSGAVLRTVRRLVVADKVNGRIQVFTMQGTHLVTVGKSGPIAGGALGDLSLPHGVLPLTDRPELLVADTGNGRIQRFGVVLDVDQDGMNDFWEDVNGLDSTRNDAFEDADGDGLFNIAEYLIGTDPQNPDTSGDGTSDGDAVAAGLDPNVNHNITPAYVLTAIPGTVPAGGLVTLILTAAEPIPTGETFVLDLSGVIGTSLAMTRQDETIFTATFTTEPMTFGVVDGAVRRSGFVPIGEGSESAVQKDSLFSVYFPEFRITSAGSGAPLRLTWDSVPGAVYRIESSTVLGGTDWSVILTVTAGDGAKSVVDLPDAPAPRFYRIRRVSHY